MPRSGLKMRDDGVTVSGGSGRPSVEGEDGAPTVGIAGNDDALRGLILHRLTQTDSFHSRIAHTDHVNHFSALLLAQCSSERMCTDLKELRRAGFKGPILCVGRANDLQVLAVAIAAGADDYLPVPDRLDEIPLRMVALMRHQSRMMRRVSEATVLQTDLDASNRSSGGREPPAGPLNWVLNTNQRTLSCEGVTINLTHSEMQILEYLRSRAHSWVTASALMQHVFGYAGDSDNTLIRVHVSSLRKKLGAQARFLESRRTLGYRWRN
jgi:DNA-binding response OmpR family regulator